MGPFIVNSMYSYLIRNNLKLSQIIWWLTIPLKIKIFLSVFKRVAVILTLDNLAKRNWNFHKPCCFCGKPGTVGKCAPALLSCTMPEVSAHALSDWGQQAQQ